MQRRCATCSLGSVRGASVIFASGDDGVGRGDCIIKDGSSRIQFLPTFSTSCTCDIFSPLANSIQAQVQVPRHHWLGSFTCVHQQ
ncbi:hypothetical protein BJY52DRAFT_122472 [Lactarius psammicola]|nr:hypothetical protein BJY52DRAFT_122472 [Lactarius psammicola]